MKATSSIALAAFASLVLAVPSGAQVPSSPVPAAALPQLTAAPLKVTVNGQAIDFVGTGPMFQGDSVLVPLRGVFEKLGASVEFTPADQRVVARKGQTTVEIHIGSQDATVNGTARKLSTAPVVSGGATLVPLRFVSEALGAQVNWQKGSDTIALTTDATVAGKLPVLAVGTQPVTGTLTGVYPESQTITLRIRDGGNRRVPLAANFAVQPQGQTTPLGLDALVVGQQVVVQRNKDGNATVIEVLTMERRGIVKQFQKLPDGGTRLLLTNGTSIELVPKIPARMNGVPVALSDIKAGEKVAVRVDPKSGRGVGLAVATASDPEPTPPEATDAPAKRIETPPPGTSATPPANSPIVATKAVTDSAGQSEPPPTAPSAVANTPTITEVTHDLKGQALKGGETINVVVKGTPKAEVAVSVPRLFDTTALSLAEKEDEPGTYTGTLTVPFNVTATDAKLNVTLTLAGQEPVKKDADDALNVDSAGPIVSISSPKADTTTSDVRAWITAAYHDEGSALDLKSVRLLVDDKDLTDEATVDPKSLTFTPKSDWPAGLVSVVLVAADVRGNVSRETWSFTVKPNVPTISRVSVAPTGTILRTGATITVRAEGAPGNRAHYTIGKLVEGEMREESPGVYTATYTVKAGDTLPKTTASITVTPREGTKLGAPVTRETSDRVTVSAAPLTAPVVEFPTEKERVRKDYVVFSGRAEPLSRVRLTVSYEGKAGFSKRTDKLFDIEVAVDEEGRWKTDPFAVIAPQDVSGVVYTVSAVTLLEDENPSPPATIRFRK